jgi:hypothetical protein
VTAAELWALRDSYELRAPVTIEDLREIYNDVKPRIAVGTMLDVVLRGGTGFDMRKPFVEVAIYGASTSDRVELPISP